MAIASAIVKINNFKIIVGEIDHSAE